MARKRVFIAAYEIQHASRLVYKFRPLIPDPADMLPLEHSLLLAATRHIRDRAPSRLGGLRVDPKVLQSALTTFLREELEQVFRGDEIEVVDDATVQTRIRSGVWSERQHHASALN